MPDSVGTANHWPQFKLKHFGAPTGIPNDWDAELLEKGVPDGLVCRAANNLMLLEDPGSGPLVCFGYYGLYGHLCLNPRSKQVVTIHYGAIRPGNPEPEIVGSAHLVGSSLDHFIALVRAVTDRFPFDSDAIVEEKDEDEATREERRFNEWAKAALDLAEILSNIDPVAVADPGGFWMNVVADVGMGNYSTKEVLGERDQ